MLYCTRSPFITVFSRSDSGRSWTETLALALNTDYNYRDTRRMRCVQNEKRTWCAKKLSRPVVLYPTAPTPCPGQFALRFTRFIVARHHLSVVLRWIVGSVDGCLTGWLVDCECWPRGLNEIRSDHKSSG